MRANALFHVGPCRVECREVSLAPPGAGEVLITSRCSAISPGTEAMIFSGAFPSDTPLDMNIESLRGGFTYPFSFGYALVGDVSAIGAGVDDGLLGKTLFAFHPHQDRAVVPVSGCHVVPDGLPPEAALFLPQMESALNFVMDGAPLIGERVLVFGQGVVGLLTAALLAEFPLERLVAVEPLAWRRELSKRWGIAETVDPTYAAQWQALLAGLDGADLVFELSGDMAALNQAIEATVFDGRIVVGSWYGARSKPLELGGRFHRNRVRLVSSQVSTLDPALSGRWDKLRRIRLAWRMVEKLRPQRLIGRSFPLAQCLEAFEAVSARQDGVMQVIFRY
jgi:2-desacetyl-2-hydroxyethyl bacteriochlorophyllide A dehydrogenase